MPIISLPSGKSFLQPSAVTILDAAIQAEVSLPYSCKTGRCSTCKCKVVQGQTVALHPETGLSEQERAEGWVLACVRTATTDTIPECSMPLQPMSPLSSTSSNSKRRN